MQAQVPEDGNVIVPQHAERGENSTECARVAFSCGEAAHDHATAEL